MCEQRRNITQPKQVDQPCRAADGEPYVQVPESGRIMSQPLEHAVAFASWLHMARGTLMLTRKKLALVAGLSESMVRRAESGRYAISARTVAKMVRAVAARDRVLAATAPVLEFGQVVVRPGGDRLLVQIELDLAALLRDPAGLTLAIVEKKRG